MNDTPSNQNSYDTEDNKVLKGLEGLRKRLFTFIKI